MDTKQIVSHLEDCLDNAKFVSKHFPKNECLKEDVEALVQAIEAIKENENLKKEVVFWMKEANKKE